MSRIIIKEFLGIAPKKSADQLHPEQAQIAVDCSLWSQGLRAISGLGVPSPLSKASGEIQKLYNYLGNWLCWNQAVSVVKGPIANDALSKIYFTGTDTPRMTTSDVWNAGGGPGTFTPPFSYKLGIPAPTQAPVVADSGNPGNLNGAYTWVFTYVRKFSDGTIEESAPSPASAVLNLVNHSANVTCPNDALTFTDYGITHKRIYRLGPGASTYFFDQEIVIGNVGVNVDNIATANLGTAINTTFFLPPPDGMFGLIALPNGCNAGCYQNVVYISDPGHPHAYPAANRYPVNDTIVGLGNVGTTIVVITQSVPEFGSGKDPAAYTFRRAPGPFPGASFRSIVSGEVGVLWATPRGIAASDGFIASMVTSEFMTEKDWAAFFPTTIHGALHDGRYYGWFSSGVDGSGNKVGAGFVLDKTEQSFLSSLGSYVEAAYVTPADDTLYVSKKNGGTNKVYSFDVDAMNPLTYTWKSKEFLDNAWENMAYACIYADYNSGLSPAQIAALNAQIAAAQQANALLTIDDGTLDGTEINSGGASGWGGEIDGDGVTQYVNGAYVPGFITWTYWADGKLRQTRLVTSADPFPLPAGFIAHQHEFQVQGSIEVRQIALASSMEELGAPSG